MEQDSNSAMDCRVLVVEDDPAIQELLRFTLRKSGLTATIDDHRRGGQARPQRRLARRRADRLDAAEDLRHHAGAADCAQNPRTAALPIIMVTAKGEEADRVEGLETGADDYLVKPFSPRELVARIQALLRRRAPHVSESVLAAGPLRLDPISYEVTLDGRRVELAPTEFKLLRFLMANPGRVFTRPSCSTRSGATTSSSRSARWTCTSGACARPSATRASS
jgi:two-component system phosphate regulon response regulator PhoB